MAPFLKFMNKFSDKLGKTVAEVEKNWVDSIDSWRISVGLDKMILAGHSMGGYISAAYLLAHEEQLESVFYLDPWGFAEFDQDVFERRRNKIMADASMWKKAGFSIYSTVSLFFFS